MLACLMRKGKLQKRVEVRNEIQAFQHAIKKDYLLHVPITSMSDL